MKGTYRNTFNHTMDVSVAVSYEDGNTVNGDIEVLAPAMPSTSTSEYKNSFHRYHAMHMQQ